MKRQALLDCIDAARAQYHNAWACTSVDLAIEVLPADTLPMNMPLMSAVLLLISCCCRHLKPGMR